MENTALYNEKELLMKIAEGDEKAFGIFVYRYTDSLYSYILKITKSEQWAEELVQDVWVQVWLAKKEFAILEKPIAYLHRMAQNKALDWMRGNKRALKYQYIIYQQLTQHSPDPVAEKADYENTRQLLEQAVNSLPPQRKRIFELKQAGFSYEDIAATLEISKNTVRNQMVAALRALREHLQQHGNIFFLFFL